MNYNDQFFELLKSSLLVNPHTFINVHFPHTIDFGYRRKEGAELLAKGFHELIDGEFTEESPEGSDINVGSYIVKKNYQVHIIVSYKGWSE